MARVREDGVKIPRWTKQIEQFCHEWLLSNFNGTQAYRKAGYNPPTNSAARSGASKLLARDDVQDYIAKIWAEHLAAEDADHPIKVKDVLLEIRSISFSNIADVVEFLPNGLLKVKNLESLPRSITAAISKISSRDSRQGHEVVVEMHDKLRGLGLCAKYLGADLNPNELIARVRALGFEVIDPSSNSPVVTPDENARSPLSSTTEADSEGS